MKGTGRSIDSLRNEERIVDEVWSFLNTLSLHSGLPLGTRHAVSVMSGCMESAMEFRMSSFFLSPGLVRERKFFKGKYP
ncbi:MAG: hypothetical protein A4E63_01816 [Syntrophorhabdus sp. PtaU1.Bin050]|nr:MAG: hypothetical protein A4E63_01816 [Syntrophorhabdus sp. PtaU1.Bin050]